MPGVSLQEQHRRRVMRHEIALMKLDEARLGHALAMMDSIPSFAQDEDEDSWKILTGDSKEIHDSATYDEMLEQARKLQYTCAGRGILQTLQDYIIGKAASVDALDENEDVQAYWDEWASVNGFDQRAKEIIRRVFRDGECFIRWFEPSSDGHLKIRFVDPGEIKPGAGGLPSFGIDTDPQDIEQVRSYHREWTDAGGTTYSEDIPADQIIHIKILVDSDVKRGVSFFVGISKYMAEYELWLKDRITLNRIRHIFNVVAEPLSGAADLSAIKSQFADVDRSVGSGTTKPKKIPQSGSVLFSRGIKWDLKALNINATDTKEDGRNIQLMIAIGTGLPEYVARGDASNANYASTMVAESPFVRAMESWQDFLEDAFQAIYERVILWGIAARQVPAESTQTTTTYDVKAGKDVETVETIDTRTDCRVNWATLVHRNLKEDTEAMVLQMNAGVVSKRTVSERCGYDFDEELDQIAREEALEREMFGDPMAMESWAA